jgi:hypothetical protein
MQIVRARQRTGNAPPFFIGSTVRSGNCRSSDLAGGNRIEHGGGNRHIRSTVPVWSSNAAALHGS